MVANAEEPRENVEEQLTSFKGTKRKLETCADNMLK